MARLVAGLLLLAPGLAAQLQLFVLDGGSERAVKGVVDLGAIDAADTLDTIFRLRNRGTRPATLETLSVAGTGFSLAGAPSAPVTIVADGALDFRVRFRPAAYGSFSAILTVNADTVFVRGAAVPGPVLSAEGAGVLASGATVEFGAVERGASGMRRFVLGNPTQGRLDIASLAVSGSAYRGPIGVTLPLTLAARESAGFEVIFEPRASGPQEGALLLNQRSFRLLGTCVEPPLPRPQILLDPPALHSGQQGKLSIRLSSAARTSGSGQLRIEFIPNVPGLGADPAIQFLSPAGRVVTFTVEEGAERARFAGGTETDFQTGTTAGAIVFTAQLGAESDQVSAPVAPAPVAIDSVRVSRGGGELEVRLVGFDNTRSISQLTFAFFDPGGRPVGSGPVRVEVASEFRRYFESAGLGGVFALKAVFPVTGKTADIAAVEVELANSAGPTRLERIRF